MMVCSNMAEDKERTFVLKRRERNRLAAQKCRKGKKRHIDHLRAEENKLDCSNTKLKSEIRELKEQMGKLQYLLKNHQCTGKVSFSSTQQMSNRYDTEHLTVKDLLLRGSNKRTEIGHLKEVDNSVNNSRQIPSMGSAVDLCSSKMSPSQRQVLQNVQYSNGKSYTEIASMNRASSLTELLVSKRKQPTVFERNQNPDIFFENLFPSDTSCPANNFPLPILEVTDLVNM